MSWFGPKLLLLGVFLVGTATGAHAALIAHDSSFGEDTVIEDTNTGLSWLRLDLTLGLSISDVQAQSDEGETFEGYRAATYGEVFQLMVGNITPHLPHGGAWWQADPVSDPVIVYNSIVFTNLFGGQLRSGDGWVASSVGGWSCLDPDNPVFPCATAIDVHVGWRISADGISAQRPDAYGSLLSNRPDASVFLVAAPVPEAETYALMLAGLGAVALIARRRKR